MSLKSLRNKVSRNGFDLSRKNCYTAKCGELLPVFVEECLPGDKFKINAQWFTRTQPVNTAAYTRLREYVDFYFVPTRLLWRDFNSFALQVPNQTRANSVITSGDTLVSQQPYVTAEDVAGVLARFSGHAGSLSASQYKNFFGYNRGRLSSKLLEYLGYGSFFKQFTKSDWTFDLITSYFDLGSDANPNYSLNIFPLLAYQKIYSDYYRNNQWEKIDPSTFNVDYIAGYQNTNTHIDLSKIYASANASSFNMFDMRYCDWNKDYFMGLMPEAQYGSESAASIFDGSVFGQIGFSDTLANLMNETANTNTALGVQTDSDLVYTNGLFKGKVLDYA